MSKLASVVGLVLLTIGIYLLLTYVEPTRAELENPYGGGWGASAHTYGGWGCVIAGGLILGLGLIRAVRANRHDPDLPPQYRV